MFIVIQRVSQAHVTVSNEIIAQINQGLMILCGFEATDNIQNIQKMLDKVLKYRIFSDESDKMNLSIKDISGELLLVPQFTLIADNQKGLRPSFSKGAPPQQGRSLFEQLKKEASNRFDRVKFGEFGADMNVNLCNDGPVTFVMSF